MSHASLIGALVDALATLAGGDPIFGSDLADDGGGGGDGGSGGGGSGSGGSDSGGTIGPGAGTGTVNGGDG